MIYSRTSSDVKDTVKKEKEEKKDNCYFEWLEDAEKSTCTAAKRAAGLC